MLFEHEEMHDAFQFDHILTQSNSQNSKSFNPIFEEIIKIEMNFGIGVQGIT